MRKIDLPAHGVSDVIICLDGHIDNDDLEQRLLDSVAALEDAETNYQIRGEAERLYQIAERGHVGHMTLAEMKDMYGRMSRKGGHARHIYDAIKKLSPWGICPLCCQRTVSTLDHYLAKTRHAAYAITPLNLVPACKDCNSDTRVRRPQTHSEQTLHPYYDEVDEEIWLCATIQPDTPPVASFHVEKPVAWTDEKFERVCHHFETFGLGTLYTTHAAVEILSHARAARRIHASAADAVAGAADVRAHFTGLTQDRRSDMNNTWQSALCQALANSEWFCAGGFNATISP